MSNQTAPHQPPATQPSQDPGPTVVRSGLTQPWTGLVGLVIVLAVFWLLGVASGAEHSLLVLGPITTFSLPVLAMVALWWNVWPGTRFGRGLGGLVTTLIVAVAALVLAYVGLALNGNASIAQLFGTAGAKDPTVPSFPFTMPLAAFVLVVFLQLTFVNRKWPFAKLSPVAGGLAALATAWVVGALGALLLPSWDGFIAGNAIPAPAVAAMGLRNPAGPIDSLQLIALLLCIVIWQMGIFFLLQGWPLSAIKSTAGYLVAANATTIVGGWLTWLALNAINGGADKAVPAIGAMAGSWVAGTLVVGLLLEGWPARLAGRWTRPALLGCALVVAAVAYYALMALGHTFTWTKAPVDLWVSISGLNFIGAIVIVHAALWRRWPVRPRE